MKKYDVVERVKNTHVGIEGLDVGLRKGHIGVIETCGLTNLTLYGSVWRLTKGAFKLLPPLSFEVGATVINVKCSDFPELQIGSQIEIMAINGETTIGGDYESDYWITVDGGYSIEKDKLQVIKPSKEKVMISKENHTQAMKKWGEEICPNILNGKLEYDNVMWGVIGVVKACGYCVQYKNAWDCSACPLFKEGYCGDDKRVFGKFVELMKRISEEKDEFFNKQKALEKAHGLANKMYERIKKDTPEEKKVVFDESKFYAFRDTPLFVNVLKKVNVMYMFVDIINSSGNVYCNWGNESFKNGQAAIDCLGDHNMNFHIFDTAKDMLKWAVGVIDEG